MALFENSYLDQLIADEEINLSRQIKAIFNRYTLSVVANEPIYTIPSNVFYITQITWLGKQLECLENADMPFSNWWRPGASGITSSRPTFFSVIDSGYNKLRFYPIPNTTIAADDTNAYNRDGVLSRVVITCYRLADVTSDEFRLPTFLLRNTIKYRALQRAYMRDGVTQDLKASQYFKQKADWILSQFIDVYQRIPKQLLDANELSGEATKNSLPQLPTTGAWSF